MQENPAPPPPPSPPRPCRCDVPSGSGCRPCPHKVCQIHKNLVKTEDETSTSFYDNHPIKVKKKVDCCTPNVVYLLQCTQHNKQYVGSAVNFKSRYSQHKCDMVKGKGEDCGFCRHWAREHKGALDDLSCLRVLLLDQVNDPGPKEEDFPNLKRLEGKWMANLGCLYSMDREHGTNIRDDAKPKQHWGS